MNKGKILLLMCHWIGDTFWAMQVIPAVKKIYPEAEVWAGVKPSAIDLLYGIIDDTRIIELKNVISDRHREKFSFAGFIKEIKVVKKLKFDLAIDLTGNRYSALFLFLSGIPVRTGLELHKLGFLYTNKGPRFDYTMHLINRPRQVVQLLTRDKLDEGSLINPESPIGLEELNSRIGFEVTGKKIALLCPGAGWKEKQWGAGCFIECGRYLASSGCKVVVSGASSEKDLCRDIAGQIHGAVFFVEPLSYFIALLKYVEIAITNDSGPAHLIAARGIRLISIFLATDKTKCGPIGKNVRIFEKEEAETKDVIEYLKSRAQ